MRLIVVLGVFLWLCAAPITRSAGSGEDRAVAHLQGVPITESALADFALGEHENSDNAQAALDHLIEDALVEQEARRRGVMISDRQVEGRIEALDREVRNQSNGRLCLADQLAQQGVVIEEFRALLRKSIACETMMAEDFGMPPESSIPEEKHKVWFSDIRLRSTVEKTGLPAGCAARVGDGSIPRSLWAITFLRSLSEKDRAQHVEDLIDVRLILAEARRLNLEVSKSDQERELSELDEHLLTKLKAEGLQTDGISYLQVLESRGRSPAEYLDSERFRARILIKRVADLRHGKDSYRQFYEDRKPAFDKKHGRRLSLSTIFLRAGGKKSAQFRRDYAEAEAALNQMRNRLEQGGTLVEEQFSQLARIWSEDVASGSRGGALGDLSQADLERLSLPADLMNHRASDLVGPWVSSGGTHLFLIRGFVPALTFEELGKEIRAEARRELLSELRSTAKVERVPGG